MNINALTVTQVNTYIKAILDENVHLKNIYIVGEISNFLHYFRSGHMYFTLKDDNSQLKAVMFSSNAERLKFKPSDGMKVLCRGRISVYDKDGAYQFYVDDMQPDGIGTLAIAFEQLKDKLSKEGLFDEIHKKPIPKFPRKIGVATSDMGAAIEDIKNITKRRYPIAELVVVPTVVQGDSAPADICKSIKILDLRDDIDVIIVGRGGGSLEDLWAFNTEQVARAVFECETPIISAVGHETDYTICDFVSDLRAPTPSAAAELAVPNISDILLKLQNYNLRYKNALKKKIEIMKLRYEKCMMNKVFKDPLQNIHEKYISLDMINKSLQNSINNKVQISKTKMVELITKLDSLSPLKTLTRGYSILEKDNKIVKSVKSLNINDEISIRLIDGNAKAKVIDIKE